MKWLESFRHLARSGSVRRTAILTGQSLSTVSHQIKCLEDHLGLTLVDHGRRPMTLTTAGIQYLSHVEEALGLLERAKTEIVGPTAVSLHDLRFAMIEDFETEIGPEITRLLADALPGCRFTQFTRPSHDILDLLRNGEIDLGVAAQPQTPVPDVVEQPVLRDPFVLIVPKSSQLTGMEFLQGKSGLPFLRYSTHQIVGQLIAAQLTRLRVKLDDNYDLDSTASILALVAQGQGWAISTPANYARSHRFKGQVKLMPFPLKDFSRTISVFVREPKAQDVAHSVATAMRSLLATHTTGPVLDESPWLAESFRVVNDDLR